MRRPLAWLIVLEVLVLAALAAAGYHLVATRWHPPPAAVAAPAPAPEKATTKPISKASPNPSPAPTNSPTNTPTPHPAGPPPGLNFDPAFWAGQLQRINRDQHALEQLQWRVTGAVTDWVRSYVHHVLLPAVREAERSS